MIDFNVKHTLAPVDEKIAKTDNPRHLHILNNFREHLVAEISGDVDAIMKTQHAEPSYHFFGAGVGDTGPKGGAAVREFYDNIIMSGYNKLRYDVDRFIVDDNALFHEGEMHIVFPRASVESMGIDPPSDGSHYVYSYRQAAIFHYDDEGICTGEDTYSDGGPTAERLRALTPEEQETLPSGFAA